MLSSRIGKRKGLFVFGSLPCTQSNMTRVFFKESQSILQPRFMEVIYLKYSQHFPLVTSMAVFGTNSECPNLVFSAQLTNKWKDSTLKPHFTCNFDLFELKEYSNAFTVFSHSLFLIERICNWISKHTAFILGTTLCTLIITRLCHQKEIHLRVQA